MNGDGATCTAGRCEGCALVTEPGDNNNVCPMNEPICRITSNGNQCSPCELGSNDCTRVFGEGVRDTCNNERECVDCKGAGDAQEGCDVGSDAPICNEGRCQGCESNEDCRDLPGIGPRTVCDTRPNQPKRCVNCVPGTSAECGAQVCGDDFQCKACDDPQFGYDCRQFFPNERNCCYNSSCSVCDPDAAPGANGCGEDRPVCTGQPPSCQPCQIDDDCGENLVCSMGRCAYCATDTTTTAQDITYNYAFNRGCNRDQNDDGTVDTWDRPICVDGRFCQSCTATADCPIGECYSGRCRVQTNALCRSRGMLFNQDTRRCFYCNVNDDQCPNRNCRQVAQGYALCGGCDTDVQCTNFLYPFCHVTQDPEAPGVRLSMCRQCITSDCTGTPTPFCTRDKLECGICDFTSDVQSAANPADGCSEDTPYCATGDICTECLENSHCPEGESCDNGVCDD